MRRRPAALALLAAGLAAVPSLITSSPASATAAHGDQRVCAPTRGSVAACSAHVRTLVGRDGKARPDATSSWVSGYGASQLRTAYGIGSGQAPLVAIVDAYASPSAAADLAVYRQTMGITAPLSLTQLNQSGGTTLASGNTSWGQEEMLDLEMVSAICPACSILYVGANSASFSDLGAAVDTAVAKGAAVVSNSYGASESSGELSYAGHYNHPGVAITVSSGDNGYGVQVPAAFNTVTAVGGTSLTLNSNNTRKSETVWSGAGSGCSAYVTKPGWQHDTGCSRRTVADVAADADPNTGVAVYDSYGSTGGNNWYVFGGTSVASPIIGAIYALSGNTSGIPAQLSYANASVLFDVVSGSNTRKCRYGYLCQAVVGYDGPTGNGTPNGNLAAF